MFYILFGNVGNTSRLQYVVIAFSQTAGGPECLFGANELGSGNVINSLSRSLNSVDYLHQFSKPGVSVLGHFLAATGEGLHCCLDMGGVGFLQLSLLR